MAEVRTIVCLADSYKPDGRCVAGIDGSRQWIRPVSAPPSGSVPVQVLSNGAALKVLDVINVGLIEAIPYQFQTENWLLDATYSPWQKVGEADIELLEALEERPDSLWTNEDRSGSGVNDQVSVQRTGGLRSSLTFIRVESLGLEVYDDSYGRKVRARFWHAATQYALKVTDPMYRPPYAPPPGVHELGESFLTVSLTTPFNGYSSKLVAAIVEKVKVTGGSNN